MREESGPLRPLRPSSKVRAQEPRPHVVDVHLLASLSSGENERQDSLGLEGELHPTFAQQQEVLAQCGEGGDEAVRFLTLCIRIDLKIT